MYEKYMPLSEPSCYILQSIYAEPKHGYGIVQDIKQMSQGTILIGNGTLYGILKRMEVDHLIETRPGDQKKTYYITSIGQDILAKEYARIKLINANFKKIKINEG